MSALTSRTRSQRRRRLAPPCANPMTEKMEVDDNRDLDWKLGPNVKFKVILRKLSKNDLVKWKRFPGRQSRRQSESQGQKRISGATAKSIFKGRKTSVAVQKLTSTSKNIAEELRYLLLKCDPNCKHCEKYILQLIQHIQSTHVNKHHECDDTDEQFFQSLISSVPEENDQQSLSAPIDMGVDLDLDPNLNLTQDSDSDSQSQSRTLVIRNTKVIYYVEEMNEKDLGQIQIPLTSEGQPSASTSTSFQNCLKNDSTEFEFVHVRNEEKVLSNSDNEPAKNFDGKMEVDVDFDPFASVGDQNLDSDPEDVKNNDGDPDFVVGEENDGPDSDSDSEIDEENQIEKSEENSNKMDIFVCAICEKTFGRKTYIQRHMARAHATEKPFTCPICTKNFATQGLLTDHKRVHAGGKHYTCKTCGKNYTDPEELQAHLKTHTGEKPFKCEKCDKCFQKKKNLQDHERCHGEKSFVCKFQNCRKGFKRNTHLKNHMIKIHTREKNRAKRLQTGKNRSGIHTGRKYHKCEICEKTYDVPVKLRIHMRSHTGERPFKCTECTLTFASSYAMLGHMKIHGEKSHICEYCGKAFHRKRTVENHIRRIHTGEPPIQQKRYQCDTCEKSYESSAQLIVHKRTHTGEKPFMCEFCSRTFIGASALADHMQIHQEKSHTCEHCGKAFRRGRDLKNHLKLHTRENPYKCEDCEESFLLPRQLELHQRIHAGEKVYKCEVSDCGRYFPVMKQLTTHKKCHTEERRFPCTKCHKSFKKNSHLTTHLKIHSGIKPHKCDGCGKCFTLPSELRSHHKWKPNCTTQPEQVFGV